jgi:isocitrate dehydrogenase (NAD+)
MPAAEAGFSVFGRGFARNSFQRHENQLTSPRLGTISDCGAECRSFGSAEVRFAQDDNSFLIGIFETRRKLKGEQAMAEAKTHKVTLIPGDGIGPEVTQAVVRIIEATGVKFEWERFAAGAEAFEIYGEYIPAALTRSIESTQVALKGPVTTPIGGGFKSINVTLRKQFDLFANFRPIKNLPGLATHWPGVDLIIVRENTEGEYVGLEHEVVPGVVESIKVVTEKGSTRIAKFAFEYARKHGRKKIHSIHKANIMKMSDGLFLRCARTMAEGFPDVTYAEHLIDNTCMQMVMNPYQYDMLLLENLYGDILSDLCAGLVGGLGLVPGANLGLECAIFEAVHGSAPDIAGKDVANPTALLQSAILMLRHLDEFVAADKVQKALETVYTERKTLTRDVGGAAGTTQFADAILAAMV